MIVAEWDRNELRFRIFLNNQDRGVFGGFGTSRSVSGQSSLTLRFVHGNIRVINSVPDLNDEYFHHDEPIALGGESNIIPFKIGLASLAWKYSISENQIKEAISSKCWIHFKYLFSTVFTRRQAIQLFSDLFCLYFDWRLTFCGTNFRNNILCILLIFDIYEWYLTVNVFLNNAPQNFSKLFTLTFPNW